MNYEDETYVRLYTRKTVTWHRLGWEGTALLDALLREVDRAGVLELEADEDPAEAISMLTRLPVEVVRPGLERALKRKTLELRDGYLIWPKFLEAQTAKKSDRARQVESRERRRATARAVTIRDSSSQNEHNVTGCDETEQERSLCDSDGYRHESEQTVTNSDTASLDVTNSHDSSQCVTPSLTLAEPEPNHSSTPLPPLSLVERCQGFLQDPQLAVTSHGPIRTWPAVVSVVEAADKLLGTKTQMRGDDRRARAAVERFAEAFTESDLLEAVAGAAQDDFLKSNPQHRNVATIWRDAAQIDRFKALKENPPSRSGASNVQEWDGGDYA